jgi:ABC-type spermidine/putrescine transport system, permease component I
VYAVGGLFTLVGVTLATVSTGVEAISRTAGRGYRRLPAPVRGTLIRVARAARRVPAALPAPARVRLRRAEEILYAPQTEADRERRRILGLSIPFFILAGFAAFIPLTYMFRMSLSADNLRIEGWSTAAWEQILFESEYWRIGFNTLWFAALAAVVSVVIAIAVTHALEKYDLPFERLMIAVISFPIAIPGIVVAFLIIVLLGRQGVVTNAVAAVTAGSSFDLASARTVAGLFVGYVYSLVPRATMVLRGTYAELNTDAEEAARALGATPLQVFYHVTLPEIRPGVVSALILTFRTALAIFGTVLILGALDVATLQIDQELGAGFNSQIASAIGVVYFLFILAFTFLALRFLDTEVVEV